MQLARELYNILLEKCKEHYRETGRTFRQFDMNNYIKGLKKERPEFSEVHSQVLQNISKRIADAYRAFFRRVNEKRVGKKVEVGFPRVKKFVSSLTYPQAGFKFKSQRRIYLSGIGSVPIVLHRLPKGQIKTCVIKQYRSGKWYIGFSSDIPQEEFKPNNKPPIGVDVGLRDFVTLSNGEKIESPKFLRKSEEKLKFLQRRVSRKKKGSKNRRKACLKLSRQYEKIDNQRYDFLHKLSRQHVDSYSKIAVEKLQIQNMQKNHHLAKSIADASFGKYIQMLHYKAWSAGCEVIEVNPKNTTQECSNCHKIVEKELSDRMHNCPSCGLSINRDLNSAINILNRATDGLPGSNACRDLSSTVSEMKRQDISEKQELNEVGT